MVSNGVGVEFASSFLRLHLCPVVSIKCGVEIASVDGRCTGTLTGSRSAGAAGRLPFLDVARQRRGGWKRFAFQIPGHCYSLASFFDNLLPTGFTPEGAVAILDDCESFLQRRWGLRFGDDSREFMVRRGYPGQVIVEPSLRQVKMMKSLGHHLDDDGGFAACFEEICASMWRSLFGNLNQGWTQASARAQMRFLNTSIATIPGFRWSRWASQNAYEKRIDATPRHMIGSFLRMRPAHGETYEEVVHRRRLRTGALATQHGRWRDKWAANVKKWHAHVLRNHDPTTWSHSLLQWHSSCQGEPASRSARESRTGTCAYNGEVQRRWIEGLHRVEVTRP